MGDSVRQSCFAAGELSPSLWGRLDSDRYAKGLRLMLDFMVGKHGAAISRPGTRFLGLAKQDLVPLDPNQAALPSNLVVAGQKIVLVPFYYSDTQFNQNCVLEFGHYYFRIWRGGQPVVNAEYGSLDGVSIYAANDLKYLRFVQSGDILFLACAGYPPAIITRKGNDDFAFGTVQFSRAAYPLPQPLLDLESVKPTDAAHTAQAWAWAVSALTRDPNTGQVTESQARQVGTGGGTDTTYAGLFNTFDVYSANNVVKFVGNYYRSVADANGGNQPDISPTWWTLIDRTDVGNVTVALAFDRPLNVIAYTGSPPAGFDPTDPNFVAFRNYRGTTRGGATIWGWVGDSTGGTFQDVGITPDFTIAPPRGINPFEVYDASGNLLRTETPLTVGFFEDRLSYFGTKERPFTGWLSASADYYNFDQNPFPSDDSSLQLTLTARKRESARSILGKDKLFVLTNGGIWAVGGSDGAITPSNEEAHIHVDVGSDWALPVQVGNSILWVRDKGTGLRAVEFDFSRSAYTGTDLSWQAEHLMLGHQLLALCHAEDPFGIVWAVREDGIVLSTTYCPDDQIWGWARHGFCYQNDGTPQKAISITAIPENGRDEVYLAMADPAGGAAWVLRMSSRIELDDEALQSLAATGGGLEYGLGMGLGQQVAGGATPAASGLVTPGTPICLDAWSFTENQTSDGAGLFHFVGLTYLANRSVYFILDGNISGPVNVGADGSVNVFGPWTTAHTASNVYVGLLFQPKLEALDLAEAREKQKVVNDVAVELLARGKYKVGATFDKLDIWDIPAAGYDLVRKQVSGTWSTGGRVCIQEHLPLPITVRGITREVAVGRR